MTEDLDNRANTEKQVEDDDTDAILAELEAEGEDDLATTRQQRLNELKTTSGGSIPGMVTGLPAATQESYLILKSDEQTLQFTTEHDRAVVHFRHPDFARCAIMDEHLDRISQRHNFGEASGEDLAFARVDVASAPFVVEKLGIRVLPCVVGFVKGIVKGKVVGFEGICWDSKEKDPRVSKALEDTLYSWGLVKQKMLADDHDTDSDGGSDIDDKGRRGMNVRRGIKDAKQKVTDEDDDWD